MASICAMCLHRRIEACARAGWRSMEAVATTTPTAAAAAATVTAPTPPMMAANTRAYPTLSSRPRSHPHPRPHLHLRPHPHPRVHHRLEQSRPLHAQHQPSDIHRHAQAHVRSIHGSRPPLARPPYASSVAAAAGEEAASSRARAGVEIAATHGFGGHPGAGGGGGGGGIPMRFGRRRVDGDGDGDGGRDGDFELPHERRARELARQAAAPAQAESQVQSQTQSQPATLLKYTRQGTEQLPMTQGGQRAAPTENTVLGLLGSMADRGSSMGRFRVPRPSPASASSFSPSQPPSSSWTTQPSTSPSSASTSADSPPRIWPSLRGRGEATTPTATTTPAGPATTGERTPTIVRDAPKNTYLAGRERREAQAHAGRFTSMVRDAPERSTTTGSDFAFIKRTPIRLRNAKSEEQVVREGREPVVRDGRSRNESVGAAQSPFHDRPSQTRRQDGTMSPVSAAKSPSQQSQELQPQQQPLRLIRRVIARPTDSLHDAVDAPREVTGLGQAESSTSQSTRLAMAMHQRQSSYRLPLNADAFASSSVAEPAKGTGPVVFRPLAPARNSEAMDSDTSGLSSSIWSPTPRNVKPGFPRGGFTRIEERTPRRDGNPRKDESSEQQLEPIRPTPSASTADEDGAHRKRKEAKASRFEGDEVDEEDQAFRKKRKEDRKEKRRQRAEEEEEGDQETEERALARAERRRQRKAEKSARKANTPNQIFLPEYISVANLASALKVRNEAFHAKLLELGFENFSNDHILNAEISGLIAQEYDFEPTIERGESEDLHARPMPEDVSILPPRPPVVTIMGHVDHGKTTLLDYLRKSSVAASEHGGITQHIGAFTVPMPSGKVITFLDTPGHAAFLDMRQRGANVTDIVILVVAADDSVKPQTVEAISHAKAAKVPMIVAINKVDKEDRDIERVKGDLARHEVDIEDFGGDTQVVEVSGKTGQGMADLESAVVALSEILDMRAQVDGPSEGWVLEASVKSMGKVATVLVRRGTIRLGDFIVAGKTWARVRCMRNEGGTEVEEATPGTPVEIDGWRAQPEAGDEVLQAPDEAKAKAVIEHRLSRAERDRLAVDMEAINATRSAIMERRRAEKEAAEAAAAKAAEDAMLDAFEDATTPTKRHAQTDAGPQRLGLIIKADVSGSLEAVINSVSSMGNAEVHTRIIRSGVGKISEFDVTHAANAKASLINFNTDIDTHIQRMADEAGVRIFDHRIIYRLGEDVKRALEDLLPAKIIHKVLGEADIAQVFSINIRGRQQKPVAGCKVTNGVLDKKARVRVLRRGEKVFDGKLSSLKNGKKAIDEVRRGGECGLSFEEWDHFREGDQIQAYEEIKEKRYL